MVSTRSKERANQQRSEAAQQPHYDTPRKAGLIAALLILERARVFEGRTTKSEIFKLFHYSPTRGYAVWREYLTAQRSGSPTRQELALRRGRGRNETRGRPSVITHEKLHLMAQIIDESDVQDRSMSWQTLAYEAELDCSWRTIRTAMQKLGYRKCIACNTRYTGTGQREKRKEFARIMLERYPNPEQWKRVRFSDEVHFGLGPQGRLLIIRKPGQRYCSSCIQEGDKREPELKKLHAWAAIGFDFKSKLVWYTVPGNTNGKMTAKVYHDEILDPIVGSWLREGHDFVLEEDRDSAHGIGNESGDPDLRGLVQNWKHRNQLQSYFNCSGSPDLAPIENAWQPIKANIRKIAHWDPLTTKQLAEEAWEELDQRSINRWVLEMPQRFKAVLEHDGRMTGY